MSTVRIPRGKRIRFYIDTDEEDGRHADLNISSLENAEMTLEEEISISVNSSYDFVAGGSGGSAGTAMNAAIAQLNDSAGLEIPSSYKQFGMKFWQNTQPLQLNLSVQLRARYDALQEVIEPAKTLMKLPVPAETDSGGLLAPGPAIGDVLGATEEGMFITCRVGAIRLNQVIIESAEPTFSNETDDRGYPITARIQLNISTMYTATRTMINDMWEASE